MCSESREPSGLHLSVRASALVLLVFMMAALFASVVTAMLVAANTQVAIRQAQEMSRSLADEARVKALVLALVANRFEIAPTSPSKTSPAPQLNEQMTGEVEKLQGSGHWTIAAQPLESDFGQFATFPNVGSDKTSLLALPSPISDYLTPEIHALLAGSPASWTDQVVYQFRRTAERTRDVRVGVRLLSFPLLRAPRLTKDSTQNKIIYWQPRDLRDGVSSDVHFPGGPGGQVSWALWRGKNRPAFYASTSRPGVTAGDLDSPGKELRDIDAGMDLSLLSKYGDSSLGVFTDRSAPGLLPWIFRQRAAFWIHAPGFIFSSDGLNAYLNYCGVTHTVDLDPSASGPSSSASLSGVAVDESTGELRMDIGQLGDGERTIGGRTYRARKDAVVVYSEKGRNVFLDDSGPSSASGFVVVLAGPADAAARPLVVTLNGSISRPTLFILYHVQLTNLGGPLAINGAVYSDPASSFAGGAGHELTVSSLLYYGGNEALSHWNAVRAVNAIPSEIESLAPRVVIPLARIL